MLVCGDGRQGYKEGAPYDCIHVGASAESVPKQLLDQLQLGGRIIIPVGKFGYQEFMVIDKDSNGNLHKKSMLGVSYVPLTSKDQ